MRHYAYMALIVIISFILSLNTIKIFSLEEMSLFITVIGLIYGLIAAFTINNAWERFSKIRDAVANETSSLTTLYILAKRLSDRTCTKKLKSVMLEYCNDVPKIDWKDYWKSDKIHKKFRSLMEIVADAKIRTEKDSVFIDQITDELSAATIARNQQLVLAQTRISGVQWLLNIFLSLILIMGLVFLNIPDYTLSVFVTATMILAIMMIFVVIYELDSMKISEEEVSNEPYRKLAKWVKEE